MKKYLPVLISWWRRNEVQWLVTAVLFAVILAASIAIFYFGRKPMPPTPSATPFFLRLHPERILAFAGVGLGMANLGKRLSQGQSLFEPLFWISCSNLVYLASIALQLRLI